MYFSQLDRLEYSSKGRNDFVSQADIEAERAVLDVLTHAYPEHGVLAEESGLQEGSEYTWVIDPLDGTTNFLQGFSDVRSFSRSYAQRGSRTRCRLRSASR